MIKKIRIHLFKVHFLLEIRKGFNKKVDIANRIYIKKQNLNLIIKDLKEKDIIKNDGKKVSENLKNYENQLTLAVKKKEKGSKSKYINSDIEIPFDQIKETRLKIKFK